MNHTPPEKAGDPESGPGIGRTVLTAGLLIVLAGTLRFCGLTEWSFWDDEISTLRDSQDLRGVIGYPVGYFLIGLAVKGLGATEFGARLLPAVFGILAVVTLYLVGHRLFTERAAVFAAVLLALSSYHVFFSQYARYYTLLGLLGFLGMWVAFEGFERNSRAWLIAAAILLGLAGLTHWTAGLLLPALATYLVWSIWRERPSGINAANIAILFAPFVAGGILFAPKIIELFGDWSGGGFSVTRAGLMVLKLADRMEPAAILCAIPAVWVALKTGDRRGRWLLAYAVVPCLVAILFVGLAQGGSRFGFVALPAIMLLAGAGLDLLVRFSSGGRRAAAWALVGLACLSVGMKTGLYLTGEMGQRPRWKEAVAYALSLPGEKQVYATTPAIFDHYAARSGLPIRALPLKEAPTAPASGEIQSILVIEHVANVAPSPDEMANLESSHRLLRKFQLHVRWLDYSVSVYGPAPR